MAKLTILGAGGGPRLNPQFSRPGIALEVDSAVYLLDCGYETVKQYEAAGLSFSELRAVFVTHRHFDHTSGIPGLLLHGWVSKFGRLAAPIKLVGPQNLSALVSGFYQSYAQEIRNFELGGGFGDFPEHQAIDVEPSPGQVQSIYEDELISVTAAEVFHGPELPQALSYRVWIKKESKSIVVSGDVAAEDKMLIELARECDVLVHEVQDNNQVDALAATMPGQRGLELSRHLYESHTDVERLPFIGALTGAKKIVFCHYTPVPQPPSVYLKAAEKRRAEANYQGEIIAPVDLQEIEV